VGVAPRHIAIDGPVASGKSTVARLLAARLHCLFLDTGALYRAVAYIALARGVSPDDPIAVARLVDSLDLRIEPDSRAALGYRLLADGAPLDHELFSTQVSRAVSPIAAMVHVRERLIDVQREFARGNDVVMAGRDIGTVVLPDARFKFYLTASLDARVDRRLAELRAGGSSMSREALRAEIESRDLRDSSRAASPLVKAHDAVEFDTSGIPVEEVVARLEHAVTAVP
jgi:cytidylate kinase